MTIIGMTREELLPLDPSDVSRSLTAEEIIYIATTLGAFWTYDYVAAKVGRVGLHALLKSELHSDGFIVSRILLEPKNIRHIVARQSTRQMVMKLNEARIKRPDYVVGVPDGATLLGREVADMLNASRAKMIKVAGRLVLVTKIPDNATLLLVEDFCTRGTGFIEAVLQIKSAQPRVKIVPYNPVIINRGGLKEIVVEGVGNFIILPVVERKIQDWNPNDCPLCALGSRAIKPKATDENWNLLVKSQLR